jgi:hypothetical protein
MRVIRITNNANQNLTNDYTNDFKVGDGVDPLLVAHLVILPTLRPDGRKEGGQVANGEKDVSLEIVSSCRFQLRIYLPLEAQACTRKDGVLKIPRNWAQWVPFEHCPEGGQFFFGFCIVDSCVEFHLLTEREIGPVDTLGGVKVGWMENRVEDCSLRLLGCTCKRHMRREVVVVYTRLWAVRSAHHSIVGRLMAPVVFEVIGHLAGCLKDLVAADVEDLAVGGADLQKQDKSLPTELGETVYLGWRVVCATKARVGSTRVASR